MSEARNTILMVPGTGEYIVRNMTNKNIVSYSLTTERNKATPLTKLDALITMWFYSVTYSIELEIQDWIILNAKHNTDEVNTQPY